MPSFQIVVPKKAMSNLEKQDLDLLMQLCKIENTLNIWLYILKTQDDTHHTPKNMFGNFELISVCGSLIFETYKTLIRDDSILAGWVDRLDSNAFARFEKLKKNFQNRETRNLGRMIDFLRNKTTFHFDRNVFKEFFSDGEATDNYVVGTVEYANADEKSITDVIFTTAYELQFNKLIGMLPADEDPKRLMIWLVANIRKELIEVIEFVNASIFSLFGEHITLVDDE